MCFHQSRALIFQSLWGAAGLFILDFCFKFMCRRNALDIWRSKKGPLISDHCHQKLCVVESRSLHWPWALGCHVYRWSDCTISMAFQSVAFYYWFNHCCGEQMVVVYWVPRPWVATWLHFFRLRLLWLWVRAVRRVEAGAFWVKNRAFLLRNRKRKWKLSRLRRNKKQYSNKSNKTALLESFIAHAEFSSAGRAR